MNSTQKEFGRVDMSFLMFVKRLSELKRDELQEVMGSAVKLQKTTWQELWNQSTKELGLP